MKPVLGVLALGVVGLATVPVAAVALSTAVPSWLHGPSRAALEEVPLTYLSIYREAAARRCPGLPWSVLAGVGRVETNHGRTGGASTGLDGQVTPPILGPVLDGSPGVALTADTDGGLYDGHLAYDRAVGPMQFIPSTWSAHGIDASGDGRADPHNALDAIHAAASYLCRNGAGEADGLRGALLAYNRSQSYVDEVLFHAARYGSGSDGLVPADPSLITAVLTNPRLTIYAAGRDDIAAGRIDARALTLLQLLSSEYRLEVSSLKSGHSRCVGGGDYEGCRVSHHWHGRGLDIVVIDGEAVSNRNDQAFRLVMEVIELPGPLRPAEIGGPWDELTSLPDVFSDAAHRTHIHLAWEARGR